MFKRLANRLIDKVEDAVIIGATKAISPHIQNAAESLINDAINSAPKARSVGGATSVCLARVRSDFKDFHAEDADTDIQTFILEYLPIKYAGKADFEKARVSEKVLFNTSEKTNRNLSNIKINNMSISDYQKSLNSATLKYRVSVGFDLDHVRNEHLYEVEYTLQLRDDFGAKTFLECQNCGAPLEESSGECKYCGMKHLRDTISNWVITDVKQK
jgi:hypothetical protein